jgi:hypothetical protein
LILSKFPKTASVHSMQCCASVSSHAIIDKTIINPVSINGVMTIQLSPQNSDMNAFEQNGYVIGKNIGEGTYATVRLAYYTDITSSKKVSHA